MNILCGPRWGKRTLEILSNLLLMQYDTILDQLPFKESNSLFQLQLKTTRCPHLLDKLSTSHGQQFHPPRESFSQL